MPSCPFCEVRCRFQWTHSDKERISQLVRDSSFRKLAIIIGVGAYLVSVEAQTIKTEPNANQLSCGQKVLVDNNTCPADEILQVTGSCLNAAPTIDIVHAQKGTQYNCVKRKRE